MMICAEIRLKDIKWLITKTDIKDVANTYGVWETQAIEDQILG